MGVTLTNTLPAFIEHVNKNIVQIFYEGGKGASAILAAAEAKSFNDGAGRNYIQRVAFNPGSAISATFSNAQGKAIGSTAGSSVVYKRFEIPAVTKEVVLQWHRDTMLAAEGGGEAEVFDVLESEYTAKTLRFRQILSEELTERGWGSVGQISGTPTTTTIDVDNSIANRFNEGDDFVAADSESADALLSATALRVTAVSMGATTTTLTLSGNPLALGWGASDFLFRPGDRQNSASPTRLCIAGLRAWVDSTAPTSTAFMGVDRTESPLNLGGHRMNASTAGDDHFTALIKMANRLDKMTGTPADVAYVSSEDMTIMQLDRERARMLEGLTIGKYKIGVQGFMLQGQQSGPIKVVVDKYLPQGTCWMGPFETKEFAPFLFHNGELLNIDDMDGKELDRGATDTTLEMRCYFRGNYVVPAPGKYGVITNLPTS